MTRSELIDLLGARGLFCSAGLFTDDKGVAYLLSCTTRTLRNWRDEGKGPPWQYTTRIVYDLESFCSWYNALGRNYLKNEEKGGKERKAGVVLAARGR